MLQLLNDYCWGEIWFYFVCPIPFVIAFDWMIGDGEWLALCTETGPLALMILSVVYAVSPLVVVLFFWKNGREDFIKKSLLIKYGVYKNLFLFSPVLCLLLLWLVE